MGIAGAAAAIVVADHGSAALAVGVWLVLAARAVGSIPFVRVQISRLRRGAGNIRQTDVAQMMAVLLAVAAVAVDTDLLAGAVGVVVLAVLQLWWVRRPPFPPDAWVSPSLASASPSSWPPRMGVLAS